MFFPAHPGFLTAMHHSLTVGGPLEPLLGQMAPLVAAYMIGTRQWMRASTVHEEIATANPYSARSGLGIVLGPCVCLFFDPHSSHLTDEERPREILLPANGEQTRSQMQSRSSLAIPAVLAVDQDTHSQHVLPDGVLPRAEPH